MTDLVRLIPGRDTQNDVPVTNGLFLVLLGSVKPIDLSFDEDYWLEIEVSVYDTLLPRMKLASVGYAYRAEWADTTDHCLTAHTADSALWSDTSDHSIKADTASYAIEAVTAESDGDWTVSGDSLYRLSGNVGIGTTSPDQKLTLPWDSYLGWEYSSGNSIVSHRIGKSSDGAGPLEFVTTHNPGLTGKIFSFKRSEASEIFTVLYNGNVGIGTTSPAAGLEVIGTGIADHLRLTNTDSPGPALYLNAANRDWVIWGTCPGADAGDQRLVFRDYTAAENRMVIDSAGKVGIGTTTPAKKLHIGGGGQASTQTAEGMYVNPNATSIAITAEDNTGVEGGIMAHNNGNVYIGAWSDHSVMFRTNNEDRGIIDAFGNMGIGITSPTEKLDVNGTAKLRGITEGGVGTVRVVVDGTGKLWRESLGNAHKENIRRLGTDPEKVFQLEPVKFDWKTTGVEDIGLVAEDVEKVIPDLVVYDSEGKPNGVRYDRITLYLLDVVKDLKAQNDALKSRIEALESKE